jgi:hypothetical protein
MPAEGYQDWRSDPGQLRLGVVRYHGARLSQERL